MAIDWMVVFCANLFNLIIVAVMLSRIPGWKKFEHVIGLVNIGLVLPLLIAVLFNIINERDWWKITIPCVMILFLGIEFILDYVKKLNFRQTRVLDPYLLIFYLSQWGMIGYAFMVDSGSGFITLLTYFISLGATAYSYANVGHG